MEFAALLLLAISIAVLYTDSGTRWQVYKFFDKRRPA
jgi:hypothetical protein